MALRARLHVFSGGAMGGSPGIGGAAQYDAANGVAYGHKRAGT